jgi:SAM-dependent methyltransferase
MPGLRSPTLRSSLQAARKGVPFVDESSVDWERDIYRAGLQLNRWPYTEVVSVFSRQRAAWSRPDAPRVLEIGFGAGNNLWFLAEAGFAVSGIEYSATAVEHAKERLANLGLSADLRGGDLKDLPYADGSFDFVLDRGALTQNLHEDVRTAAGEIHRVLVPGGQLVAFTLFGEEHPDRRFGTEVAPGSLDHFTDGYFRTVGLTSFFSEASLRGLFDMFRHVTVSRTWTETHGSLTGEDYSVVATK